jgi:RND family efflux transporter MFP subunit
MKPILICLAVVGLLAGCEEQQHVEAPALRPVLTVVVAPLTAQAVGFAGTVEPRYTSDLGFRVLGRLISRDVNVGEVVKEGQRLAKLDPVFLQLAVRSARADLASAIAQLENAAGSETRKRTLLEKGVVSKAEFEAAEQAGESAAAGVTRAQANLDRAEEQLAYTELRAPFDGVITAVKAEPGQVVQPGETVLTVARPDIREAVVDLPESMGRALGPESRFDIALQLDPTVRAAGSVREIDPHADRATRTQRVKITLDNPPESFRLGTTITATLSKQGDPAVQLPSSALLEQEGKTKVWIVDPTTGTVSIRDVTVAAGEGSDIRVLNGLTPGTRVVAAGVNSLTQGQAVLIQEEAFQ